MSPVSLPAVVVFSHLCMIVARMFVPALSMRYASCQSKVMVSTVVPLYQKDRLPGEAGTTNASDMIALSPSGSAPEALPRCAEKVPECFSRVLTVGEGVVAGSVQFVN